MTNTISCFLCQNGIDISSASGRSISDGVNFPSYYWALSSNDALVFINLCKNECVPIIGIEIFEVNNNCYSLLLDNFIYQKTEGELFWDYFNNSTNEAINFIK